MIEDLYLRYRICVPCSLAKGRIYSWGAHPSIDCVRLYCWHYDDDEYLGQTRVIVSVYCSEQSSSYCEINTVLNVYLSNRETIMIISLLTKVRKAGVGCDGFGIVGLGLVSSCRDLQGLDVSWMGSVKN